MANIRCNYSPPYSLIGPPIVCPISLRTTVTHDIKLQQLHFTSMQTLISAVAMDTLALTLHPCRHLQHQRKTSPARSGR